MSRDWDDNIFLSMLGGVLYLIISGVSLALKYVIVVATLAAVVWVGGNWLQAQDPELKTEKDGFWGVYNNVTRYTSQLNKQAVQIQQAREHYDVSTSAVIHALVERLHDAPLSPIYNNELKRGMEMNTTPDKKLVPFFNAVLQDPDPEIRTLAAQAIREIKEPELLKLLPPEPTKTPPAPVQEAPHE